MITEFAEIRIQPGTSEAFLNAVAQAAPLFRRARGCQSMRIEQRIEEPDMYILIVGWETLEDHEVHFRQSADFQSWRELVGKYFTAPPTVTHTQPIQTGF
jgi:heme-degrading monooxygenase HmoA